MHKHIFTVDYKISLTINNLVGSNLNSVLVRKLNLLMVKYPVPYNTNCTSNHVFQITCNFKLLVTCKTYSNYVIRPLLTLKYCGTFLELLATLPLLKRILIFFIDLVVKVRVFPKKNSVSPNQKYLITPLSRIWILNWSMTFD